MTEAPDVSPDFPDGDGDPRTGNEEADAVLDSLAALADLPVDAHVAVFERAHEQLRGALDPDRASV
jgi:hypothetical protein